MEIADVEDGDEVGIGHRSAIRNILRTRNGLTALLPRHKMSERHITNFHHRDLIGRKLAVSPSEFRGASAEGNVFQHPDRFDRGDGAFEDLRRLIERPQWGAKQPRCGLLNERPSNAISPIKAVGPDRPQLRSPLKFGERPLPTTNAPLRLTPEYLDCRHS